MATVLALYEPWDSLFLSCNVIHSVVSGCFPTHILDQLWTETKKGAHCRSQVPLCNFLISSSL